jgi:DNA-binding MarR family transcriptional regulator
VLKLKTFVVYPLNCFLLEDKRQKFLTLTPKGHELYEIVCLDVQKLQQAVVAKTNLD